MVFKLSSLLQFTENDFFKQFICGLVAGFVSVTVCHPLDVIRTRMNIMGGGTTTEKNVRRYANIKSTIKTIWKNEWWRGFYRGYSITVISIPFFNSVYFPIYNLAKKNLKEKLQFGTTAQALLGSIIAGSISNTLTNPIWVMRTRYMVEVFHPPAQRLQKVGLISAYRRMIKQEGYRSLFKGWASSMLGIFHAVVYFPIYQNIKKYFSGGDQKKLKSWQVLLASITSKICASFATYPHVVVRTIMQDDRTSDRNIKAVLKKIYNQHGIKGFYLGLKPDLFRILPSNAIVFVVYEFMKKQLF